MDAELQAIREARLAQLKNGANATGTRNNSSNGGGSGGQASSSSSSSFLAPFLEPQALERLSRVSLVRPERAQAVENYLKQLIQSGQLRHKISGDEIIQILNGISKQESKQNDSKIIFDRKGMDSFQLNENAKNIHSNSNSNDDSEDDFFDED